MASKELASPITLDELRQSLTPEEQKEFDQPDFVEPLKLFLEGFNNVPNLRETTRAILVETVRNHVIQRAAVEKAVAENPDVLKTELNPVVIIGMARTGTTMLQRLLASAPQFLSPMTWETMFPCPPPGRPENWQECDRYATAKATMEKMFPEGLKAIENKHEVKLEKPDECMYLLQAHFLDLGLTVFASVAKWKDFAFNPPQENLRKAYEYYKKALQCIFYQNLNDSKMTLLKAPIHTLHIDMYRTIFPNAKFIFPYRNAKEMIGSGCSIFSAAADIMGIECTKEEIKKYTLEYNRLGTSRVIKALKDMPQESYYTVSYSELMKDPMAAMRDMYSHFGWDLTQETEENMKQHMQENQQHRLGAHKYSIEEFGITEDELRENLTDFLDYFGKKEKLL